MPNTFYTPLYVNLNDINEGLDDVITEETFEDNSNIDLNNEENTNNPNFFQLDMNAFQSARHFSAITDNVDDYMLELDSNFDNVISMATDITNEIQLIEISEPTKLTKFTTCVLIDNFNGEIRSCGSSQNLPNWLLHVADHESPNFQEQLSCETINLLQLLPSSQKINHASSTSISKESTSLSIPSPFIIKAAFKLNKLDFFNHEYKEFDEQESFEFGQGMAKMILKNRKIINNNKNLFENPNSLIDHHNIFPSFLSKFFLGLVNTLQLSKFKEINRKKQFHNKPTISFDPNSTIKTRIFLMFIIFHVAFSGLYLWLPTMLASLIRKPKLTAQLHQLLTTINAVAHTQRHERKLENIRITTANPHERLWVGDNIWNIGVIDNIDFKEKTFAYSNIFDQTRSTTHATLRMVFQYKLPTSLSILLNNILPISDISTLKLWGENIKARQFISNFHQVFNDFLQFLDLENTFKYFQDFDLPDVHQKIVNSVIVLN
ncbi:unnamed protein product [Rhizophagus irregularis]|nr:unnamed protein product [Rhizophagus irregularis]